MDRGVETILKMLKGGYTIAMTNEGSWLVYAEIPDTAVERAVDSGNVAKGTGPFATLSLTDAGRAAIDLWEL